MTAKQKWPLTKRVEVEWRDSMSQGGWDKPESYHRRRTVGPCRSIGYLVRDDKGMLTLAQSLSAAAGDINDCITIPREAVVRLKRIRDGLK